MGLYSLMSISYLGISQIILRSNYIMVQAYKTSEEKEISSWEQWKSSQRIKETINYELDVKGWVGVSNTENNH